MLSFFLFSLWSTWGVLPKQDLSKLRDGVERQGGLNGLRASMYNMYSQNPMPALPIGNKISTVIKQSIDCPRTP